MCNWELFPSLLPSRVLPVVGLSPLGGHQVKGHGTKSVPVNCLPASLLFEVLGRSPNLKSLRSLIPSQPPGLDGVLLAVVRGPRPRSSGGVRESDGLDLEMQGDKAENQRLEVLHQIVEDSEAFRIGRLGHVVDRSYFSSLRRVSNHAIMGKAETGAPAVPQTRCDRFQLGFPAPASRPYSW